MFAIPEEQRHSFNAVAYMIERKLLDIQMELIAHKSAMRYEAIEYTDALAGEEISNIEITLFELYDLLKAFCEAFNVSPQHASIKNEFFIKANFLWEDITGASTRSMRDYGQLDENIIQAFEKSMGQFEAAANKLINTINKP